MRNRTSQASFPCVVPRLLCIVAGLLLGAVAFAQQKPPHPLNDTGQITCYNNSAATGTVSPSTPNPEDPGFEGQDCTQGRSAQDALGVLPKHGSSTGLVHHLFCNFGGPN